MLSIGLPDLSSAGRYRIRLTTPAKVLSRDLLLLVPTIVQSETLP